MPLLRFRCTRCGKTFEELVAIQDMERQPCPDCGGKTERAYEGKCNAFVPSKDAACPATGRPCGCAGSCPHA